MDNAPTSIIITDIGNFFDIFLLISTTATVPTPIMSESRLKLPSCEIMWLTSSNTSPVPAVPPKSFATCISMIVHPIPDINPPSTGFDI